MGRQPPGDFVESRLGRFSCVPALPDQADKFPISAFFLRTDVYGVGFDDFKIDDPDDPMECVSPITFLSSERCDFQCRPAGLQPLPIFHQFSLV